MTVSNFWISFNFWIFLSWRKAFFYLFLKNILFHFLVRIWSSDFWLNFSETAIFVFLNKNFLNSKNFAGGDVKRWGGGSCLKRSLCRFFSKFFLRIISKFFEKINYNFQRVNRVELKNHQHEREVRVWCNTFEGSTSDDVKKSTNLFKKII